MNPKISIAVDAKNKAVATITGMATVGAKVDVEVTGILATDVPSWGSDDDYTGYSLRFRIVDVMGKDLVRYQLNKKTSTTTGDVWTVDTTNNKFTATNVDFDTDVLRKAFVGVPYNESLEFGLILDSYVDKAQYAIGKIKIRQWAAASTEDPTVLPDWREVVERIDNASASVTKSGTMATISITDTHGTTTTATVSDGAAGPANTLSIGSVGGGSTAGATITGTSPNQILNLTLPKGDTGDQGVPASVVQVLAPDETGTNKWHYMYARYVDGKWVLALDQNASARDASYIVPQGGATGQVLTKNSATDYDAGWANAGSGDVSGATMNGETVTKADGILQLGTVITAHQDISGKADASDLTALTTRVGTIEGKESTWDGKQSAITSENKLSASLVSGLSTVATSGSYNDLSNQPTIPSAQVQTDWNAASGMGVLLNKPSSLPNPNALSIKDASDTSLDTYDGSVAKTIKAGTNITLTTSNNVTTISASGGSGGTSDYDQLSNKPLIAGTTLSGNKSLADLGIMADSVTHLSGDVAANTAITGATKCKVTYDSKGLVTAGEDLSASDIPDLSAAKITSGTFADERIASASTWNAKQAALPTTGSASATYAINVSGNAATATTATTASSCTGNAATASAVVWSGVSSKPTTIAGYGITDANINSSGVITLGSNTITPITAHATHSTNDVANLDTTKCAGIQVVDTDPGTYTANVLYFIKA